jgi:hypothetical protein
MDAKGVAEPVEFALEDVEGVRLERDVERGRGERRFP